MAELNDKKLIQLLRSVVQEELAPIQRSLASHQAEELEHHKAVDDSIRTVETTLKLLIQDKREQAQRISLLESRLAKEESRE